MMTREKKTLEVPAEVLFSVAAYSKETKYLYDLLEAYHDPEMLANALKKLAVTTPYSKETRYLYHLLITSKDPMLLADAFNKLSKETPYSEATKDSYDALIKPEALAEPVAAVSSEEAFEARSKEKLTKHQGAAFFKTAGSVKKLNEMCYEEVAQFAEATLKKIRNATSLGSANIKAINYDPATDSPLIVEDLLADQHPERRVQLDALVDGNIKEMTSKQIKKHAGLSYDELLAAEDHFDKSDFMNVRHVINAQAGNCESLSQCALMELIKAGYEGKAEVMEFSQLSHVFLVLNRPPESNKKNWKTWGKDTVILDAWINKVFIADQLGPVWREYGRLPGLKTDVSDRIQSDIERTKLKINGREAFSFKEHAIPWIKMEITNLDDKAKYGPKLFQTQVKDYTDEEFRTLLSEEPEQERDHSFLLKK